MLIYESLTPKSAGEDGGYSEKGRREGRGSHAPAAEPGANAARTACRSTPPREVGETGVAG